MLKTKGFQIEVILSQHAQEMLQYRGIQYEWVIATMKHPTVIREISEEEIHYFSPVSEAENRCLKVVFNPTSHKLITTYFDRNMRKKGCK